MDEATQRRAWWSLENSEVQAAKARFERNRRCHPHKERMQQIAFNDLFEYFRNSRHPGVRHKARELHIHPSGLRDLYNRYLRKFFGKLNRNAGPPRRKSKSAA